MTYLTKALIAVLALITASILAYILTPSYRPLTAWRTYSPRVGRTRYYPGGTF